MEPNPRSSPPEPFSVDPNALYGLEWLRERLRGIVELPTFMQRLGLRDKRIFRDAVTGREILDALAQARPFSDAGEKQGASVVEGMHSARGKRTKASPQKHDPLRRLSAEDLKQD